MTEFRTGRHVVHRLNAHLVLTTKYRRGAIVTDRVRDLLSQTLIAVANGLGAEIEAVNFNGDHAHLLIAYPPQMSISALVNALKGVSSRYLRQKHWPEVESALWGEAFWSPSYCVVSCGGAPLEIVKAYVEGQDKPGRSKMGTVKRLAKRSRSHDKTP